jgi:hypothetical protein
MGACDITWISVKDKLPPCGEGVIMLVKWGGEYQQRQLGLYLCGLRQWQSGGIEVRYNDVTHWNYIPKHMKDEADNEY